MSPLDWAIVVGFLTASLAIGAASTRLAGRSFGSFFLGDRSMPWWMLGVSMVATTFSTDTPNLVTDIVRSRGVAGNWTWWAFALTGLTTTFLYARLWRRSGLSTDVEFYEIRYSGPLATFLRGFRAIYLAVVFNVLIMASVTLAAIKIAGVLVGSAPTTTVTVAALITTAYSVLGGLRGVVLADLAQFALSMFGAVAAAVFVLGLPEVGGLAALLARPEVAERLAFVPDPERTSLGEFATILLMPLLVQWWAAYYPGAEPGGGGYVAQRMLAARDERSARAASLLFNFLHYAVRPWPWVIVALASLAIFPDLASLRARFGDLPEHVVRDDLAYPAMLSMLPPGLLGLVAASLAAAYMSTMSTQVNWGASVLVNDVYRRFVRPDASARQLVWCGRWITAGLMATACALALLLESALQVFGLLLQIGAGTGLLFLLRWFWWRINAAAELTAMLVSLAVAIAFETGLAATAPEWAKLLGGVGITTLAWGLAALLGPATDEAVLRTFYERIRPDGPGWARIRVQIEGVAIGDGSLPRGILSTALAATSTYGVLFSIGFGIRGAWPLALLAGVLAAICGSFVFALLRDQKARTSADAPGRGD
jgi:SSS family solute:Na+ symporter